MTQFICRGPQCQPTMAVAARQRREEKLEFEKVQIGDTPINFPFTPYPLQVPHSHKHPLPHLLLNLKMTAHYPLQVKSTPALGVQDANSGCSDLLLILKVTAQCSHTHTLGGLHDRRAKLSQQWSKWPPRIPHWDRCC